MIKLGKLTDYAVVVMAELARDKTGKQPRSAAWLSDRTGVPEPTVAKILKTLAKHDLLVAQRGAAGGYRLAASADDISIGRIIVALEGPIAIISCVDGHEGNCVAEHKCQMRGHWDGVNQAIRMALESVSLQQIAENKCPVMDVFPTEALRPVAEGRG